MFDIILANPVYGYFFIFSARVIDVSLSVFRLLMLTRGYAVIAAAIGFFEVSIFVLALGTVITGGLNDPVRLIVYAAGFATGNLIGSIIEDKMAFGFVAIQMFPHVSQCDKLITSLRNSNYGVTRICGEGASGPREILVVCAKRKNRGNILSIMNDVAPETFFNISDIRSIHGGIFPSSRP
jgi:uncharacterized protein YebE (UPF0316 family)